MSYNNNVLGQSGSIFFFGVVEDNNDPEKLGRVKVRVYGVHSQDKGILSDDFLPWASVALPVTANEQSMPDLYPGTTVFGFFLDGDEMQVPFVTGIVPGIDDETDTTTISAHATQRARESAKKKDENRVLDEPSDTYAAEYPHNRATVTKSGHVVEYDDTPGAERIHVYHKSGSYMEFLPDGRIVTKAVGDQFSITKGKHSVGSTDTMSISSTGAMSVKSDAAVSLASPSSISMASGDATVGVAPGSVTMAAGGASIGVSGGSVAIAAGGVASSGVVTAPDVVGGGHSLAGIGAAIAAAGGIGVLAAAIADIQDDIANLPDPSSGAGGWGSTDLTPPAAPAGLEVSAGITSILITHDEPAFTVGGGYKSTHVYMTEWFPGLPQPTLENAVEVHAFSGTVSSFAAMPGKKYVVWARFESKAGALGEPAPDTAGMVVETGQDVEKLTDLIRQSILTSDLYATLSRGLGIDALSETVTQNIAVTQAEINRRRQEIKAEQQARVTALLEEARARGAAINTERDIRQSALDSVAQEITLITAAVDETAAAVQTETIARATALSAEAAQRTLLASRVQDAESSISQNFETQSDINAAQTAINTTLTSRIGSAESTITDNFTTLSNDIQTEANRITTLRSDFDDVSADLIVDVGTIADATGHIGSKFAVTSALTAGGRTVVGGFGLIGTNTETEGPEFDFGVLANRFWIGAPTENGGIVDSNPFTVQTTATTINGETVPAGVYITDAFIKNGTITNAKIGDAQIDNAKIINLDAGKITTGFIDADRIDVDTITADKITVNSLSVLSTNLGNITAGSIDINSGTSAIDAAGNAVFRSMEVIDAQGKVRFSVKPIGTSFDFPEVLTNVPEYINNNSLYIDAEGNLSSSVAKTPSDPQNLVDYSLFQVGETLPTGWAERSDPATETSVISTVGPKGIPTLVMRAFTQNTTSPSDGGYVASPTLIPVSGAIYRVIQPIKRVSATVSGNIYLGPGPSFVAAGDRHKAANGTATNNPYWQITAATFYPIDEWCFIVGYMFPSNTTLPATNPDDAGLYKVSDGTKLANNTNGPYILTLDGDLLGWNLRSFLDSSTGLNEEFYFGVPMVHEVDGTEPAITSLFKGTNLRTMGFAGDFDATKGAPAGTLINGIPVEDVTTVVTDFNLQNNRDGSAISIAPTAGGISDSLNADGSADITYTWNWAGTAGDIDGYIVYVYSAATNAPYVFGTSVSQETAITVPASKKGVLLRGISADRFFTLGVVAYRTVDPDVASSGVVFSAMRTETAYQPSTSVNFTGSISGVSAATVGSAATNFSTRNDRNQTAIVLPTILADGTAVDHVVHNNGTADISFEWDWTGAQADIDGFRVYVYSSTSSAPYTFGTTPAAETVYEVPANRESFILYGVNPTSYYTFGVQAYRVVDADVPGNVNGMILSTIVQPSRTTDTVPAPKEHPYHPATSTAFIGDITGTIGGMDIAVINSVATNFNARNDRNQDDIIVDALETTGGVLDFTLQNNGSADISFEWAFPAASNSTIDGWRVIVRQSSSASPYTILGTAAATEETIYELPAVKRSFVLYGVNPSSYYTFGIQAYRVVDPDVVGNVNGLKLSNIVQPTRTEEHPFRPSAGVAFVGDITGTIGGTTSTAVVLANSANGQTAFTGTAKYRTPGAPTNAPVPTGITVLPHATGSRSIRLDWDTYVQGTNPADFLILFWFSGTGAPTANDSSIVFNVNTTADSYFIHEGTNPQTAISYGIAAARRTENGLEIGAIVSPTSAPDWQGVSTSTPNFTGTIGGTPAATINSAITNFNSRNDTNGSAVTLPVVASDGGAIDHTVSTPANGSVDISFEWTWGGVVGDIDGFRVYVYKSGSASPYTFGTTPAAETVYEVPADKRAFILYGVSPTSYYTFGVQAYRVVDPGVGGSTNGLLVSSIVQSTRTLAPSEHPYNPETVLAFAGNITGTVNSVAVATVTTNAANGNTAFSGTTQYRVATAPTNQPAFGAITQSQTADGNVVVEVNYTYTQGATTADQLYIFYSEGSSTPNSAADPTAASPSMATNAASGVIKFTLKPNISYKFGLQAVRRIDSGVSGGSIVVSGFWQTATANFTGAVAGIPATDVNNFTKLSNVPYATIFNNDDSTALGYNPAFADWPTASTYPTGWILWTQNSGSTITKETSSDFVRVGANSVKMVCNGGNTGIQRVVGFVNNPFVEGTFINGTVDVLLGSVTSGTGRPGVLVRLFTSTNLSAAPYTDTQVHLPSDVVYVAGGVSEWQRVPWTARVPAGSRIYGIHIYLMGSWTGWTDATKRDFNGTVYFDNLRFMLADKTTDNIQLNLTETAGTFSLVNGGTGSVTTITANNHLRPANVATFMDAATITNAYIGNTIQSTNYEMYNLIRDFVANPATNYTMTTGAGLTIVSGPTSVTGAVGAITGYTAARATWTGTSGGGYLSTLVMTNSKKAVSAGDLVEAHVYCQCLFGTARLMVKFANAAGTVLATTLVSGGGGTATMAAATGTLTSVIANFAHLSGFVTAPANTAMAWIEVQVARTATGGNTDLYVNIPSLAVVMDSSAVVHTWPATSGLGGAGWILNKTSGMEINAANIRGKLTTDQLQVGAVSSHTSGDVVATLMVPPQAAAMNATSDWVGLHSFTYDGGAVFTAFAGVVRINRSGGTVPGIFKGKAYLRLIKTSTSQTSAVKGNFQEGSAYSVGLSYCDISVSPSGLWTELVLFGPGTYTVQAQVIGISENTTNGAGVAEITSIVMYGHLSVMVSKV